MHAHRLAIRVACFFIVLAACGSAHAQRGRGGGGGRLRAAAAAHDRPSVAAA